EPLSLLDVRLLPDHLLRGRDERVTPEDFRVYRTLLPLLVDHRDAVSRAEDQVYEIRPVERLGDPEWIGHFGAVPGSREKLERLRYPVLAQEQIEVLGVAPQTGVSSHRVRATDHRGKARILQQRQRAPVHSLLDRIDLQRRLACALHEGNLATPQRHRKRRRLDALNRARRIRTASRAAGRLPA